ncbi:hypothetical protein BDZ45DRAFT_804489 [Acephala macrosclerotiorum]|nr:hypothetical protein BDZ45DRAFT_804489 [Acephala macrosclerotiorum]
MSTNSSQSQVDPSRLETFHPFPKLPVELRLKVWKFVSFLPRIVDVWSKNFSIKCYDYREALIPHYMFTRSPPPAILQICRESRNEALKHYTLDFAAERDEGAYVVSSKPRIYINWKVDTVCLLQPEDFHGVPSGLEDDQDYDDYDQNINAFVVRMEEMGLKSMAINILNSYISTRENNRGIDIPYLRSAELLPIGGTTFEELILFSDTTYYRHDTMVGATFEDLSQEAIDAIVSKDPADLENMFLEGKKMFDAYFSWAINEDEEVRKKYESLNVRLCKVKRPEQRAAV